MRKTKKQKHSNNLRQTTKKMRTTQKKEKFCIVIYTLIIKQKSIERLNIFESNNLFSNA